MESIINPTFLVFLLERRGFLNSDEESRVPRDLSRIAEVFDFNLLLRLRTFFACFDAANTHGLGLAPKEGLEPPCLSASRLVDAVVIRIS